MWFKTLLLILFIYFIGTVLSDEEQDETDYCHKQVNCTEDPEQLAAIHQLKNKTRYDYARIYKVYINTLLQKARLKDFTNFTDVAFLMDHRRDSDTLVHAFIPANKVGDFESLMKTYSFEYNVVNYNFQLTINNNLDGLIYEYAHNRFFDWEHYFNLHAIYTWMEDLALKKPYIAKILYIGNGTDGLPIKGLRLDFTRGQNKHNTAVVIEAGIYADQWITTATATYFINRLLSTENSDEMFMAQSFTWIIFPTINPDGYEYTMISDRMWRKNREIFGICRGVNLNRNFPYRWKTIDPTKNECDTHYQGPHAASALETRYLMSYLMQNFRTERIRTYIALHSFSQLVLYPYSSKMDPGHNKDDLATIAYRTKIGIFEANKRERMYESGYTYKMLNPYSGSSTDWVYDYLKIPITLTLELRGPQSNIEDYFVPANKIEPTANDAFTALKLILRGAADKGYYGNTYPKRVPVYPIFMN